MKSGEKRYQATMAAGATGSGQTRRTQPDGASAPSGANGATTGVTLAGVGGAAGIAIGPALVFLRADALASDAQKTTRRAAGLAADHNGAAPHASADATPLDPAVEHAHVHAALTAAIADLQALAQQVTREIGASEAGIFESQALMLEDPTILERANMLIDRDGLSAHDAIAIAAEEQAALLAALPEPIWQARAADVRDAAQRALDHITPADAHSPSLADRIAQAQRPVIVIADDLAPSDTVGLRADQTLGIALVGGSATSHAAILARALAIPTVVGLGAALLTACHEGDTLVVDGASGAVTVRPTSAQLAAARQAANARQADLASDHARATEWRLRPGRTRDGRPIQTLANIGSAAEARVAVEMGAEGVGLLRTEFLFAGRPTLPDEYEQADLYSEIFAAVGPSRGPIIVRTLDAGADKPLPALAALTSALPTEQNPALGVRGARLSLYARELLLAQFRGVLRAAARARAQARLMLPMIATVEELREARTLLRQAREQLTREGVYLDQAIPLGIMIETPAAVFAIEALARDAAFFSIGTNDLTQYLMAADRLNPQLAALCQPTQPAVLRAIATVVSAAQRIGRPVGVCGEMAGEPELALLLVGMGVHELSMTPQRIPAVKEALASYTSDGLRALAIRALQATSVAEVQRMIADALANKASAE